MRLDNSLGIGRNAMIFVVTCILLGAILLGFVMTRDSVEIMAILNFGPGDGEDMVDVYSPIFLFFSETVREDTLTSSVSFSSPIVGEWNVNEGSATFRVAERMRSNTMYVVSVSGNMGSANGKKLGQNFSFSFTTGNTSSRIATNGTSVQLDFIAMTEDGLVFATSLQSVKTDNATYPKSPFYIDAYKQKLNLLRRFPVIIGKEDEFFVFEREIMNMKIGETKTIFFGPDEPFGTYNQSLVQTIPLNETMSRLETMERADAVHVFDVIENGSKGVHPMFGWNVTIHNFTESDVVVRADPSPGDVIRPFGWDTTVLLIGPDNITLRHMVNQSYLYRILAFRGVFPQKLFMVAEVNNTADMVTIDSNWPPGVVGQPTTWIVTIYDIKHPEPV